jgi:predicted negative regulator of RcsB-dependent stress response
MSATLLRNIGMFAARHWTNTSGLMCRRCLDSTFSRYTMACLVLGWWGVISFFATPIALLANLWAFLTSRGLPTADGRRASIVPWLVVAFPTVPVASFALLVAIAPQHKQTPHDAPPQVAAFDGDRASPVRVPATAPTAAPTPPRLPPVTAPIGEVARSLDKGDPEEAADALKKLAAHLARKDPAADKALTGFVARLERDLGKGQLVAYEQAIKMLQELPDATDAVRAQKAKGLVAVARARLRDQDAAGAQLDSEAAIELVPSATAWLVKGDALAAQGQKDDAAAAWQHGLDDFPTDAQLKARLKKTKAR